MGDIVNLRSARKAKARELREVEAQENRAKFGRTKGEKAGCRKEAERATRLLDGAFMERTGRNEP
ncbi:conserved hypothetical protein [Novosphingobium aromaticivorans DSM 12444]|uniref:DUF4169 domain-containing protein n=1 Tax=Novosphingobium aromaticivorans (strain ATCC 700278 / DSM 12444 / CCUG 56034 / CIP 105152 / NBRC 16084 / F199) TaxID=279238 RepID=Q2G8E0_NOVAD|nr:DUF4169 family protein [Novosphingobium aromaticivorans]ABD25883.1 conserved hypothetical protein [Novosphingobium aromaticivorans DSM 12444]SCY06727.1 protein of unknown function [Novosphingobium aromaticivorans]